MPLDAECFLSICSKCDEEGIFFGGGCSRAKTGWSFGSGFVSCLFQQSFLSVVETDRENKRARISDKQKGMTFSQRETETIQICLSSLSTLGTKKRCRRLQTSSLIFSGIRFNWSIFFLSSFKDLSLFSNLLIYTLIPQEIQILVTTLSPFLTFQTNLSI